MYQNALAKTGAGVTVSGVALSTLNLVWMGIAIAVLGGTLITASKFAPRIALEPVPVGINRSRFRITLNGKPLGARRGTRRTGN